MLPDEPEFTSLLKKARRRSTADLMEVLLSLYDGDDLSPRTRSRPITVQEPFFCVITTTTPENLEANLTPLDIESGLMPRFMVFLGTERPALPYPDPPNHQLLRGLADRLADIERHARAVGSAGPVRLRGDVLELWRDIFECLNQRAKATIGPGRAMLERIPAHVIKLALLYALQAGHTGIELEDLQRAGLAGTYIVGTAGLLPDGAEEVPTARVEAKLLKLFEAQPDDRWLSANAIHRIVGGRVKASEVKSLLAALVSLGRLEKRRTQVRGRTVWEYREAR